ncbi:MAG: hypothetical protein M0021_09625 [Clostridia bacterium]|nr:hypothetical protein [Clostridia bacterium]
MALPNSEVTKTQPNKVVQLGDSEVFVKKTPFGEIQAVKANVRLEERKSQLYVVQGKCRVTADGYNELNKIAGVSVITPSTLQLPDGNVVSNPYPIIDRASGSISKVWVKKIAVGLTPIGNLVITSSTLLYDIGMYFIQDLYKKIQRDKMMGRACMRPMLSEKDLQTGMFFSLENELGIWVDVGHPEFLKAMDTYIQNKLFAERKAQTICERNALRKHPALATVTVIPQGADGNRIAVVPVVGYTHKFSKEELGSIAEQAVKGETVNYNGQEAEIIETTATVVEDDENEPTTEAGTFAPQGQMNFGGDGEVL